ncbi:hypothetical protein GcM3_224005 [Golovinomyces cichoracearum]|uniref:Uncharacterized protein n=1 Tax=Golovinomyces cichoracearum TaxID=62708 RepID=A0A420GIM1_9PEZI|nr:hypothetical protein GcM3_224005 [Golovinomyces cichoracearum]
MNIFIFTLFLAPFALSSVYKIPFNSTCTDENPGKQISGSLHQSVQPMTIDKNDCSSFMHKTVTSPSCTEYTTETIILNTHSVTLERAYESKIPHYGPSDNYKSAYTSSVCSSLGITATTATVLIQPTTITITEFISETSMEPPTLTTSTVPPSCTADTLTDPQNCGECGNVCQSGTCESGSCTDSKCRVQSCGKFDPCGDKGGDCYCFTSSNPVGDTSFCGRNAICSGLTACATDLDCVGGSSGNICAISTCCPRYSDEMPGVCLEGQCSNPARKLIQLSRIGVFKQSTAAF